MSSQTLTHYAPYDADDLDADRAVCGHRMTDADRHATQPTCPACVAAMAAADALDAVIADTPLPLDADEAATELDPVLNSGAPDRAVAEAALAALVDQRATVITRHEAAYDEWLGYRGRYPSPARFEAAVEALDDQIVDAAAALAPRAITTAADLFEYAVTLTRVYAAGVRRIA